MSTWTVRRATLDDIDFLVRGNAGLATETEDVALDLERLRAGVHRVLQQPSLGAYFVATRDTTGEAVGQLMITTEWSDWRNGVFWWIQSVFVDPSARRQGIYRGLYQHVLEEARRDEDVCGIRLYVEHENHTARATYDALGMKPTAYEMREVDFVLER